MTQQEIIKIDTELHDVLKKWNNACKEYGIDNDTIETQLLDVIEKATSGECILYR